MILVTGGTGFIGPKVVHALRAAEQEVRCLVRQPAKATTLKAWRCELAAGDVTDPASLGAAAAGCDVVIHLVSIIAGKPADFERVMVAGTRNLLAAAKDAGVRRVVLMSALGTSDETKDLVPYYGAKWKMEQATNASGLEHVIFRPSFVLDATAGRFRSSSVRCGGRRLRRWSATASGGSSRSGSRTSPPTLRRRSTSPGPPTAPSSLAGPTR